jgi:hypothetical protein
VHPTHWLISTQVPGTIGAVAAAPGPNPPAAAPPAAPPAAPAAPAAAAAAPPAAAPLEAMLRARAPPKPEAPKPANPIEAMLQRKQAPPPAKLQRIVSGEPAPDPKAALNNLMKARAATDGGAVAAGAPLRDHPAMKPFVKLLRVGLPRPAVARKMAEDGLDASLLDKDLDAPPDAETLRLLNKEAPATTRQWGGREAKKRASLKPAHCCVEIDLREPPRHRADVATATTSRRYLISTQVHWEAIENNTEGTVWAHHSGDGVDDDDKAELHRLFGVDHSKTRKHGSLQPKHKAEEEACEAKRSANIAISLATLAKPFDGDLSAMLRAACEGAIAHDIVEQLVPMLPSDDEFAKARRLYRKSGPEKLRTPQKPAESLFVAVVDLVQDGEFEITSPQDLRSRLQLLGDALSAPDASTNISEDAQTLIAAADGARTSKALAECLRRLLDVGNALNAGTRRGDAKGFTLASLERVAATKSTDASAVSVLDFAARKALTGDGEHDLEKLEPLLRAARKLELRELEKESTRLARCSAKISESALASHAAASGLAEHVAAASQASSDASSAVLQCSKFFGEESPDCAHLFGALHDLVARFQSARLKVKADEERRAKQALEEKRKTPEAKRERRRERRRGRAAVDDVLRAVDAGKK